MRFVEMPTTCEILKTRVIILLSFKQSTAVLRSSSISLILIDQPNSAAAPSSPGNQRTETQTSVPFSYIHKSHVKPLTWLRAIMPAIQIPIKLLICAWMIPITAQTYASAFMIFICIRLIILFHVI